MSQDCPLFSLILILIGVTSDFVQILFVQIGGRRAVERLSFILKAKPEACLARVDDSMLGLPYVFSLEEL